MNPRDEDQFGPSVKTSCSATRAALPPHAASVTSGTHRGQGTMTPACTSDGSDLQTFVAIVSALVDLQQQMVGLMDRVAAVEGRGTSRLSKADQDQLERLLPVLAATYGSRNLTVKELLAAPAPGLKLVLGDSSSRRLGKLLARGEGTVIATYMIEKIGTEGHAAIWRIVGVVPGVSNSGRL